MNQVSDFMVKNTVSVTSEMSLLDAVKILSVNNLRGAPVINSDRVLVGLITEKNFLIKDSHIHLPTFIKLFEDFGLYRKDKFLIKRDLVNIRLLRVEDLMDLNPTVLSPTTVLGDAAKIFIEHPHISPFPVVDEGGRLVGVLSAHDLINAYAGGGLSVKTDQRARDLDEKINHFIKSLNSRFIFVSKARIKFWLLFSIVCLVVGFFLANVLLLQISFK